MGFNWSAVFWDCFNLYIIYTYLIDESGVDSKEMEMIRDEKLSQSVKRGLGTHFVDLRKNTQSDPNPEMELRGGGGSELGSPMIMHSSA